MRRYYYGLLLLPLLVSSRQDNTTFVSFESDPQEKRIGLYWKNEKGKIYGSLGALRQQLEQQNKKLVFAANGGMYKKDRSPLGLYVENGRELVPLNSKNGSGNFYMQPNGVFYINQKHQAFVCETKFYPGSKNVLYATQSGPMLVINGKIHPSFNQGSTHTNIRNGVGILPNGHMLFAMSKEKVSLYDFALYFKSRGCQNALYLDGYVSRTWLPQQGYRDEGGSFGVIVGITGQELH